MKTANEQSILPLALRETKLTESDVVVLLRIARDKKSLTGRYKRTAKRVKTVADQPPNKYPR